VPELDDSQKDDVEQMLDSGRWGLFHEMGVGKTPPAIVAASQRLPALAVVPAYLHTQWREFIQTWAPGASIADVVAQEERTKREQVLQTGADFTIVSYHMWASPKPFPELQKRQWGSITLDEGHRIRGRNSVWTKRLYQLDNADNKNKRTPIWDLTGTPIIRDAGDVYPFLHLCARPLFNSYWNFVESWCKMDYTPWGEVVGDLLDPRAFYEMLSQFSSRRELGMGEPVWNDIPVELPRSVYEAIRNLKRNFVLEHPDMTRPEAFEHGGAVYSKIRQVTALPPTAAKPVIDTAVDRVLEDLQTDRVIVFCWHQIVAKELHERFLRNQKQHKRPVAIFTGAQSARQKTDAIETYNGSDNSILVATISALAYGANLQAGNRIVFVEESELGAEMTQSIARQLRRGQEKQVVVDSIQPVRTVYGSVRKAWQSKDQTARSVMMHYLYDSD
jgi:superfamily II DNA or RNA helicase